MEQFKRPQGLRGRFTAALMNQGHKPLSTWGLSYVNIEPEWLILDVGCGGGKTVGRLAQRAIAGKVFGIDYSPDMVKYSKKVNKKLIAQNRVEIIEGSVQKMAFSDSFFDLVTAFETYYFWSEVPAALQEIKRVLRPNGTLLIVSEMVKDGTYEVKHKKMIEQTGVRLIPLDEIRNILQSVGFVDTQVFTKTDSSWNTFFAKKGL
ncbi:MAG: class I SAM-dependent methyltransferase [Candidatus Bathyarchaeia archaeon]|jgi:ubiquinone/menaquinone biosynthesis C-methylase UbiE